MNPALLGTLVIGASAVYGAVGVVVARRFMKGRVLEGHNDVLSPLFATAGVIYAVLLGFMVIVVWGSYGDAKDNISDEATRLTTLYRLTAGMRHPDERATMRATIREYTKAVVDQEWISQAQTGAASPEARTSMGKMFGAFHVMPLSESGSQINGEFLRQLSAIMIDRNRRILQAGESLPFILWFGLVLGGAIVVGMTFILYMEATWPHVAGSCILAALIGSLLYVTIVFNRPFVGPMALTPEPFEYAVSLYDSVDKGQ
jgi:hypothetical protein